MVEHEERQPFASASTTITHVVGDEARRQVEAHGEVRASVRERKRRRRAAVVLVGLRLLG
jgi:hypothetical protein